MKRIQNLVVIAMLAIAMVLTTSCEKDQELEQVQTEKGLAVLTAKTAKSMMKSTKSTGVDTERPNDIDVFVKDLYFEATSSAGKVYETFNFMDTPGATPGTISLTPYLGSNDFFASTGTYEDEPMKAHGGGQQIFSGFRTGGYHSYFPFDGTETTTAELAEKLRTMRPYAKFEGKKDGVRVEKGTPAEVTIDLETPHGRFFATYEFADAPGQPLMEVYKCIVEVRFGNSGQAQLFSLGQNSLGTDFYPMGWTSLSNDDTRDGEVVQVTIKLFDINDDTSTATPLRVEKLHEKYPAKFKIEGGVDKYIAVSVTESFAEANEVKGLFNIKWEKKDDSVDL